MVRELLLGPKRFTGLRQGLPHVSPDVLSQRLRDLERAGIVRRAKLPPPAGSRVYELTERGAELEPVVLELGRWGSGAPFPPGEAQFGPDSAVIALMTVFDASRANGLEASYELRLGEHVFRALVTEGRVEFTRAAPDHPDATIATDPATLANVLWHGRDLDDAEGAGDVAIEGDRAAAERFLALYPLPE